MTLLAGCVAPRGEAAQLVALLSAGAARLATLLDDILDFGSLGEGSLRLRAAPFDVRNELVLPLRKLLEMCSAATDARRCALRAKLPTLTLVYDVAPDVPRALIGDVSRLSQVALNLLTNVGACCVWRFRVCAAN